MAKKVPQWRQPMFGVGRRGVQYLQMNRPLKVAGEVEQGLQLKAKREAGRATYIRWLEKKEEHGCQLVAEGMRGWDTVWWLEEQGEQCLQVVAEGKGGKAEKRWLEDGG